MEGGERDALLDFSGNGNDASPLGNPAWDVTAGYEANGAFGFDGDDGLNPGENFPTLSSYSKSGLGLSNRPVETMSGKIRPAPETS